MLRSLAAFLIAAGLARPCLADEVVLRSGQKIQGIAREEGDRIVVEVAVGTVSFPKKDVVSVTRGRTILHDFKEKVEALAGSRKADEWYALAAWGRENGLGGRSRALVQKVLELDPQHEWARRELGFQLHKGKWMTREEVNRDLGLVLFEGRWVSELEKSLIVQKRLDAELARAAADEERRKRREEDRLEREEMMRRHQDRLLELERLREIERRREFRVPRRYYYGTGDGCADPWGFLSSLGWRFTLPGAITPPPLPLPGVEMP